MSSNNKNEWSTFANQHSMTTIATLLLGGFIACVGKFKWWPVGVYAIVISAFVFVIEYPRSDRPSRSLFHKTRARPYQHVLANVLTKLDFFYHNYFPRFILYFILSIPCFLTLSTFVPALNLLITACLYLFSNFKKEKWAPIKKASSSSEQNNYKTVTVIMPPERPPPRTISDLAEKE